MSTISLLPVISLLPFLLLITQLQREFALKDLSAIPFFLGIQAHHDSNGLHLHQGKYVADLLPVFQVVNYPNFTMTLFQILQNIVILLVLSNSVH